MVFGPRCDASSKVAITLTCRVTQRRPRTGYRPVRTDNISIWPPSPPALFHAHLGRVGVIAPKPVDLLRIGWSVGRDKPVARHVRLARFDLPIPKLRRRVAEERHVR